VSAANPPNKFELGASSRSGHFGITSLEQAQAFAAHPVLGDRLQAYGLELKPSSA